MDEVVALDRLLHSKVCHPFTWMSCRACKAAGTIQFLYIDNVADYWKAECLACGWTFVRP